MKLKKYSGLSQANQKIITEVAAEAVDFQRELSIKKEEAMLPDLRGSGIKINRDVDGVAFQKSFKPVWKNFIAENGDDLINDILNASN